MVVRIITLMVIVGLLSGCATITDQGKMDEYGRTMDTYETAIQQSDFNVACKYVDPAGMNRGDCLDRYENMKIANYKVLAVNVAEDKGEVTTAVEVEYFFLDQYIVKKHQYDQTWFYNEALKRWFLKEGPPLFK
jgi:uncharacterized protein YceK